MQGYLDVGDGHELYWETLGSPAATPLVFLHGGPGAGATPDSRRYFDPAAFRGAARRSWGPGYGWSTRGPGSSGGSPSRRDASRSLMKSSSAFRARPAAEKGGN
jgi:pimeloyl-ACP methyl ester carboxylesterase